VSHSWKAVEIRVCGWFKPAPPRRYSDQKDQTIYVSIENPPTQHFFSIDRQFHSNSLPPISFDIITMLDTTDLVILILVTLATLAYFTKGKLWAKPAAVGYGYGGSGKATANGVGKPKKTRNIVERMEQQNKNVVVFFGSQTVTAGMTLFPCGMPRIQQSWSENLS
jgi:hypothetical protein